MYSRFHSILPFLIALMLSVAAAAAEAQVPADPPPPATLRGQVTEPAGALPASAKITISTPTGVPVKTATADASGSYIVHGLAPGSYIVRAAVTGFAPFQSHPIQLEAGQSKKLHIAMATATAQQDIVAAQDQAPEAGGEAGNSAPSAALQGNHPNTLSGDQDELCNDLKALAGPEAGPNGGQIYINGFMGRQAPSKSANHKIHFKGLRFMKKQRSPQPQN